MRALAKLKPGPGQLDLVERPEPTPGPKQVVVEVHGAGICGTDLHIAAGEYPTTPPVTLGHEVTGVVIEVGSGVAPEWRGRRVVTETYYSTCQACPWCRDGRPNLCPERQSIGSHVDGGFAARLAVPAANLHAVPDWLDDYAAALAEPLACVCNCLLDPPAVQPGDDVVVTGPGPVGLLAAQVARNLGGSVLVCGLAQDAERLAVAERLGFAVTDGPPPAGSADVAVECSGAGAAAATCLAAVRRGGRLIQVGVFGREVTAPLDHLVYAELALTSGFASTPRSWRRAMSMLAAKSVDLGALVSQVVPLAAWPQVFDGLPSGRGMKTVFDPRL